MKKLDPEKKQRLINLQEERESRALKRKNTKKKKKPTIHQNVIKDSNLLNYLVKHNFQYKTKYKGPIHSIKIPKDFSFITNQNETLRTIAHLVTAINDPSIEHLNIDHSECLKLDLGASAVMDVIILEATKTWKSLENPPVVDGFYSIDAKVNEIIKVSGIIKNLKHKDAEVAPEVLKKYELFTLQEGSKSQNLSAFQSTQAELIATKLTDYVDKILGKVDFMLTLAGKKNFIHMVSEVLDNAEQHSHTSTWYVSGYLNEKKICNIAIFNFGETISETLSSAKLNWQLKNNIQELIKTHSKKGFFKFGYTWSAENLWTLYALQEGISRFNIEGRKIHRGQGTVRLIEFFLDLASKNNIEVPPRMVLISGNTFILFDGKYSLKDMSVAGELRQVIAFNEANSLEDRPDQNNIKKLKFSFPGTIITMRFCIEGEYLKQHFS